ncbi:unnamed protein product [Caenorhabditis sp. 36 PRJEB53466]|nr:unnamed protein product [Caenorhabditis sp. 36 PRJEB53466]
MQLFHLLTLLIGLPYGFSENLPKHRLNCRKSEYLLYRSEEALKTISIVLKFRSSMQFDHLSANDIVHHECWRKNKRSAGADHPAIWLMSSLYEATHTTFNEFATVREKANFGMTEYLNNPGTNILGTAWFRHQLQALVHDGKLNDMIRFEPSVYERIVNEMPYGTDELFGTIEARNVVCYQDRHRRWHLKLQLVLPDLERIRVEECEDFGEVHNNSYAYYEMPDRIVKYQGKYMKLDTRLCEEKYEHQLCLFNSLSDVECTKNSVEFCEKRIISMPLNQGPFVRQMKDGKIYVHYDQNRIQYSSSGPESREDFLIYQTVDQFKNVPIDLKFKNNIRFEHLSGNDIIHQECSRKHEGRMGVDRPAVILLSYLHEFTTKTFNHLATIPEKIDFSLTEYHNNPGNNILAVAWFRYYLQDLVYHEQLSDLILFEPKVYETIVNEMPRLYHELIKMIEARDVVCYQDDLEKYHVKFQLVVPDLQKIRVEECEDFGEVHNNSYAYYEMPDRIVKYQGKYMRLDERLCEEKYEHQLCLFNSLSDVECTKHSLEFCEKRIISMSRDQKPFVRQMKDGKVYVHHDQNERLFLSGCGPNRLLGTFLVLISFFYSIHRT